LKSLAGALREESLAVGSRDGKIWTGSALMQDFPGGRGIRAFLGIELDIRLPGMAGPEQAEKGSGLLYRFRRAALCAALVPKAGVAPPLPIPPPPVFSFRAAALANIGFTFRALSAGGHAAEWETGPLIWLPDCKRRRGR
jgi:hypothetical protein